MLGRVNPDYFLGGDVKLDPERARAEVKRQVAEPLGLEVDDAAAGVIELFEQTLKNEAIGPHPRQGLLARRLRAALLRRRRAAARRRLHRGRRRTATSWCPRGRRASRAYGCACADFEYRYDQTIDMPILPTADEMEQRGRRG